MSFLSKLQSFNAKLESDVQDGQFGVSRTDRKRPTLFGSVAKMTVIIIDCSGSMSCLDYPPNRLEAAINAATEYVNTLTEQNAKATVAVVSFSDQGKVVVPPTTVRNIRQITDGLRSIKIYGGTNIGNGLEETEKVLNAHSKPNAQSHIILLTDGFGDCPLSVPEKLKQQYGTIIDVVGIGGSPSDVNESLLRKVATTDPDGTNHYRFIADARTLKQHYRQLATGLFWKGEDQ